VKRRFTFLLLLLALLLGASVQVMAQATGSISGSVTDEKGGLIPNATVTVRNVGTSETRTAQTDDSGRYRFESLPTGAYEVMVEAGNFAKYVRTGITLVVDQKAVIDVEMTPKGVQETVTVTENASLLNTSNAEVGVRFDERRISELPLATNRNVYNVALSAAGISQLGAGQTSFSGGGVGGTSGVSYSANGGRVRSNNFMIDGQDNNDFGVAGAAVPLNNPDLIQEVRLVTNQFTAEYGRNGSSVFNAITKSGTNAFHGSAFWFHNDNALNACSNTEKGAGFCLQPGQPRFRTEKRPFRVENQVGGTIGGPLHLPSFGEGGPTYISGKDRTFFFASAQRWYDRQLGSGQTLNGAPTVEGKQLLQSVVGNRPQIAALLRFLPAAQGPCSPACSNVTFTANGQTFNVPVGSLTGTTSVLFDDWQASFRIDHRFSNDETFSARYLYQDSNSVGSGQITPPGFGSSILARTQGLNLMLTSVLSPRLVNELRGAYVRNASGTLPSDPTSELIPSIEISQLGLTGFNAATDRTAIGLGVNLPQYSFRNTFQLQDNISFTKGSHTYKFGVDIRRNQLNQLFKPTTRGRLAYSTLQRYIDDIADTAIINKDLPGTGRILYLDWHDFFFYAQDEWKIRPNFTLTYGLRYEIPGQPITDLVDFNAPVLAAAGGNPLFKLEPVPGRDTNNIEPRLGFNWNLRTRTDGPIGWITGGDKLVLRGGYARTHDYTFTNIALNIWSAFPFVAAATFPTDSSIPGGAGTRNAFANLQNPPVNPTSIARTIVSKDFHTPTYDQFSFEIQRELSRDAVLRVGYVGTKGTGLFLTIDGNPTIPFSNPLTRVNPTLGPIRLRDNAGSSIYHSLQVSMDKRLSRGFSAGVHYTWSSFIDDGSEIFNPSSGEVAVAQDSYCRACDRGRSTYDRPHRFTGNFVYELPFFSKQTGFLGHVLGGWQVNSFFTFQSGAPFTPLNGTDPTGALSGISGLVGIAIRPNVNSSLDLSGMTIEELYQLRQAYLAVAGNTPGGARDPLFRTLVGSAGQRVGNAGRNTLRADGIGNVDFGIVKNFRLAESQKLQLRADFYNATNTRNFGIPEGRVNSVNFLNQWGTNGGNRRIIVGIRYSF
jgi:hypothetical protein